MAGGVGIKQGLPAVSYIWSIHILLHHCSVKLVAISNVKEDPRKRLKERLQEIQGYLKEKILLCTTAQESNHMYRITTEKNPVKSFQISYSIFFIGKT